MLVLFLSSGCRCHFWTGRMMSMHSLQNSRRVRYTYYNERSNRKCTSTSRSTSIEQLKVSIAIDRVLNMHMRQLKYLTRIQDCFPIASPSTSRSIDRIVEHRCHTVSNECYILCGNYLRTVRLFDDSRAYFMQITLQCTYDGIIERI